MYKKLFNIIKDTKVYIFLTLLVFSLLLIVLLPTLSNDVTTTIWDGTISSSIKKGNGTKENPYQISTPNEFALFISSIGSEEYEKYYNKHYILTQDINLGDKELLYLANHKFSGTLDGRGHTISNIKRNKSVLIDEEYFYSLFPILEDATIKNIVLKKVVINADNNKSNNISILSGKTKNTIIKNVLVVDSNINTVNNDNLVGGLLNYDFGNNNISNIYLNINYNNPNSNIIISTIENSKINNVIVYSNASNYYKLNNSSNNINNIFRYTYKNNAVEFIDNDRYIVMNKFDIDDEYYYYFNKDILTLSKRMKTNGVFRAAMTTGITPDTVIINNLEIDKNYYDGLNYTSNEGKLPTLINKDIYNETNLVKVAITYEGYNIDSPNEIAYVSKRERQRRYVYYHYMKIDNGYVTFDLIDNPFTDLPHDKAFNGWITNYPNALITFDKKTYTRSVRIPLTYTNGKADDINIVFYPSYTKATISEVNSSNFDKAFQNLKAYSMHEAFEIIHTYESVSDYYVKKTVSSGAYYPSGAVNQYGDTLSGRCSTSWWGPRQCEYYIKSDTSIYDSNTTYYKLVYNWNSYQMNVYYPAIINTQTLNYVEDNKSIAGYFRKKTIPYYQSYSNLYNNEGVLQTSGTCFTNTGCEYYELINYYNDNNQKEVATSNEKLYYLATRDTNILLLKNNIASGFNTYNNKPFTLTSVYNDQNYLNTYVWDVSRNPIFVYNDAKFVNIAINSNAYSSVSAPSGGRSNGYLYANYNNVKIGRGIRKIGNYKNFNSVIGGDNSTNQIGSITKPYQYKLIVESGSYNNIILTNGNINSSSRKYVEAVGVYGNDYDKIKKDNTNLDVYFDIAGSFGGYYYSSDEYLKYIFNHTLKSGTIGASKHDYTTGVYVGGRNYGQHNAPKIIKVEGGAIYNLIGGPLTNNSRTLANDTVMEIVGGDIDVIIGGAGRSATYGNRIIQMTGGVVNYSVFGGSNGYEGSSDDGTLNGSSYIYLGGNAIVGKENLVNNNSYIFGSEAGSVFGIGNGRSGYPSIGSNDNSNIIIDKNALIRRNVYGGGNYGATGISSSSNKTETNIIINGGNINGSLYGGGNNNGSGSSSKASIINIEMNDGTINGSLYGGSNQLGRVYGNVNLNIYGGQINNDVYGGGEGGYTNSSRYGTFVEKNILVNIGNNNKNTTPNILGSVYGGSAYGSVNGTNNTSNVSNYKTIVNVNKALINGSVYGGGRGSLTYTPYVMGTIEVNINGGNISNVFGGCDYSGIPNSDVFVNLNGGILANAYGGGNNTGVKVSNVKLNGSKVSNLFGGSNQKGDVNTSNLEIKKGEVDSIFGGNNIGGNVYATNVLINGSKINYDVYGGGNKADTNKTNIIVNNTDFNIAKVFAGGKSASVVTTTTTINGGSITDLYGGSNIEGQVNSTNLHINKGYIKNVFGGNNEGGLAAFTNIYYKSGVSDNLYGGGNKVDSTNSNIKISGGHITNLYGGGNEAGIDTSNIELLGGHITNSYGGSNQSGHVNVTNTTTNKTTSENKLVVDTNANIENYNLDYKYKINLLLKVTNNTSSIIDNWQLSFNLFDSKLITNNSNLIINKYNHNYLINDTNIFNSKVFINPYSSIDISLSLLSNTTDVNASIAGIVNNTLFNSNSKNIVYVNNIYGGNNNGGSTNLSNIVTNASNIKTVYGGGNKALVNNTNVIINNGTITDIYGGGNEGVVNNNSSIVINNGIIGNVYGGGNKADVTKNTQININGAVINENLYGGGNLGNVLENATINMNNGKVLGNIYGGGNKAGVLKDTKVLIRSSNIDGNVYGGGNEGRVNLSTNVNINSSNIKKSVYAGGNGNTAIVLGNTTVSLENNTVIGTIGNQVNILSSVFGGGNAAETGVENTNNSLATVNIVGAKIYGNVYGGANTSVVYGKSLVNIGYDEVSDKTLQKSDIYIRGTVFGGGEANASGSENYDYSFISVTNGIDVNINGNNYNSFDLSGSIFGSGNASSTKGISNINIKNYGTFENYKNNISIQRTNNLTIDNSNIKLVGATDRTNEYSDVLFTLSIIDELKLSNNSTLFLETGANLLKSVSSIKKVNNKEEKAQVIINKEEKIVEKNVDNRIYMYQGKNLNIATNESVTNYGNVSGMTFFGMFVYDKDHRVNTKMYHPKYNYSSNLNWGELFEKGSYVLGLHKTNHNIEEDGFYSNFMNKDTSLNEVNYITPTPDDATFYMWVIGEVVIEYNIDLVASKYSTLGSVELSLLELSKPNTSLSVLGFNASLLNNGVSLIPIKDIPRVASNSDIADNVMGLAMKTTNNGWLTNGKSEFISSDSSILGDKNYVGDNSNNVPSLQFYLYHSKNLKTAGNMGTASITVMAINKIDDLTNETKRIVINVNLSRALYNTNDYEAGISAGRKYEMFSTTTTNITSKSSVSAYFSLFKETDKTIYQNGYHRVLVSGMVFPENTKITMIDFKNGSNPEYYYYNVSASDVLSATVEYNKFKEVSYPLSRFKKMGSNSNNTTYNDKNMNNLYFDKIKKNVSEEFIFIVDFEDTSITSNYLNNSLLFELRDANNQTIINVLGVSHAGMVYSIYNQQDSIIDIEGSINKNTIYLSESAIINFNTNFLQSTQGAQTIYDTKYFDDNMGIKISILNSSGEVVTGASLIGLNYKIGEEVYYPGLDGYTRIKISDRVGNISKWITINTLGATLATGNYQIKLESYASPDGLYYGLKSSDSKLIPVKIINGSFGLKATTDEKTPIIDSITGTTEHKNSSFIYNLEYSSNLDNPNLRIKLYRRNYDIPYDTTYTLVDLKDYISNTLEQSINEKEYYVTKIPTANIMHFMNLKSNLITGTYKIEYLLYDNEKLIGSIEKYIIIR